MNNDISNATRFINAYNQIDQSLRSIYNFRRSMSFNDMVRRCVPLNSLVRKFEDKIIDYGRLRNAIVHNSKEERIIAEPHNDVVEEFEYIAKVISEPPLVIQEIANRNILVLDYDISIKKALETVAQSGFKCIPVCKDEVLCGVITPNRVVDFLGTVLLNEQNLDNYISRAPINAMINNGDEGKLFEIKSTSLTVEEALNLFYSNRKLQAIIITRTGSNHERPVGILTVANIIDLNKAVEDYDI